ncbi:MAG: methyltransferase domain-containing protein [Phycisphaerales bacterium]
MSLPSTGPGTPLRLHVGGEQVREGWKILNIQPHPGVDFVGTCIDLSQFTDGSVSEIYASHVYEHLSYAELEQALREAHRALKPGGLLRMGVPDLQALARLLVDPRASTDTHRHIIMMIYGGQIDPFDFHKVGFTWPILQETLEIVGFRNIRKVDEFHLFDDITSMMYEGRRVSLNVQAQK